jgi:raffinose/stachyose/melibiose transport system substrate-binding protein
MKKLIGVLAVLLGLSLVLPGCENDKSASGGKTVIRFMYWNNEDSIAALLNLIHERLPDIDFQFEYVSNSSYSTIYSMQMAAGEGPDIIDEGPNPFGIDKGWALDLAPYDFIKRYTQSGINELSLNGKVYAVPGVSWFGGFFYNKGMFDEHGWTIPQTYAEFLDLCEKIQAAGIKPIANPIKEPNYLMHYALAYVTPAFLRQPEGMNWDRDFTAGRITMSESLMPYMEEWAEIVKRGFVTKEDLGMDTAQAIDEFAMGRAAMLDSGPWDVDTLYSKNPDLKLDMMPFVGNKAEPGWLFGGPGISFGINSKLAERGNEKKLDAALRILDLISTPEAQVAYWENNSGGSSYLSGVELEMPPEYDGCSEVFASGNIYAPFMQWNEGVYEEFGKQLQGYVAGTITLQQVLAATDAKNAEVIEKYMEAQR